MATILFVDDDEAVRKAVRRLLHKDQYEVLTADSGAAALDLLRTVPVDVVVSDDFMSGMRGATMLGQVRRAYPDIVRILLTGGLALERADADYVLTKPIAPTELRAAVARAVASKTGGPR